MGRIRSRCDLTVAQVATVAMPILVPAAMQQVFRATHRRWGPRRGQQAGFAIYWATCWATAATLVGPRRLVRLWQRPVVAAACSEGAGLGGADRAAGGGDQPRNGCRTPEQRVSVRWRWLFGVGVTNAVAEEALWRGAPVAVFGNDPVLGWLWPAVGFTLWHLVPLNSLIGQPAAKGRDPVGCGADRVRPWLAGLAYPIPGRDFSGACPDGRLRRGTGPPDLADALPGQEHGYGLRLTDQVEQ